MVEGKEASMEWKQVPGMKSGDGENSYPPTSSYTQKVAEMTMPIVYRVAQSLFPTHNPDVLNVADLGCSSGPSTFILMSTILQSITNKCSELRIQTPEILFYLNDLPSNDFNALFKGLSGFSKKYENQCSCFFAAVPGSFHGRLFPRNTLHLVHSSYCVHWLSKFPKIVNEEGLPLNRGNIYVSETSPSEVRQAYFSQFQQDFSSFLKSRSSELVPNGLMVLILHGRESEDATCKTSCYAWQVLSRATAELANQGLIDKEKLDDFNVPYYSPCPDEVRQVVEEEGSFTTEQLETTVMELSGLWPTPEQRVKNLRDFTESMLLGQFGEEVMDKLYSKVEEVHVANYEQGKELKEAISIAAVLRKKTT